MVDYGRDISGATDVSATLQESTGDQLMREVICRRLGIPNASLLSAPDELTCDLRDFLSTDQPTQSIQLNTIRGTATAALLADPRILTVKITIDWFPESNYMSLSIVGTGADGPFRLTLGVNRDTITVLTSQ